MSHVRRWWLFASGLLCAVGALFHLALPLGGPGWYSFAGAPQGIVAMAQAGLVRPVISCIVIACLLVVFAGYAFSALGSIRRLPALRIVLGIIGVGLSVRALWLPVLAVRDPGTLGRFCGRCGSLNPFVVASSALCLFIGVGYLLGAWRPNPTARPSDAIPEPLDSSINTHELAARRMNDNRNWFRKGVTGAACGFAGVVAGGFMARAAVRYFAGSAVWELPAIICGALTLFVVAVLVVAPAIGAKALERK